MIQMLFTTVLIGLLITYTLVWALINLYNLYPLLAHYTYTRRKIKPRISSLPLPNKLPKITVLLPAFHEEVVLQYSVERIFQSDYPNNLIEVIILTEKEDAGTIKIANGLAGKYGVKHVRVKEEEGGPQGKPRALNVGLKHVGGEIVGVVDAEDIIDRKLFKNVVRLMNSGYDAVQGVLDMVNDRDGFTNMHLRAEYRYWYMVYLPALTYSNFPVPLGGTTNFFRRDVLDELGGWDPYNVTEDFELGVRLYNSRKKVGAVYGMLAERTPDSIFHEKYKFGMMASTTKEESPTTWEGWLKQRTRWQRGKIQTLKKVAWKPPSGFKERFHSVMMGLVPHLGLINISGIVFSGFFDFSGILLPPLLVYPFAFNMSMVAFYCTMEGYGYFSAVHKNRKNRLLKSVFVGITTPIYWALQWAADIRAIKHEYFGAPVFWERTTHHGAHIKKR